LQKINTGIVFLSRNLDQNACMPKIVLFLEKKAVKIAETVSGGSN